MIVTTLLAHGLQRAAASQLTNRACIQCSVREATNVDEDDLDDPRLQDHAAIIESLLYLTNGTRRDLAYDLDYPSQDTSGSLRSLQCPAVQDRQHVFITMQLDSKMLDRAMHQDQGPGSTKLEAHLVLQISAAADVRRS